MQLATPPANLPANLAEPQQVHGGSIVTAAALASGRLAADGVVLEAAGEIASVSTADCAAVAFIGDQRGLLLHISRKTLIYGLVENAFSYITPADINTVYVGPHICEYHFAFEREEAELKRFRIRYPRAVHFHQGKLHLSLRTAITGVLHEWDIDQRRVTWDGRCTFEHAELPSYRRSLADGAYKRPLSALRTVMWREK